MIFNKIKNIPTSFLFGLFFLFILSFSVSSTWAAVGEACDTTYKGPRTGGSVNKWRHDLINACLPGTPNTKCYRKVDLTGLGSHFKPKYNKDNHAGKCLLSSTSHQQKCNAICGSGKVCRIRSTSGSLAAGYFFQHTVFHGLGYEKVDCDHAPCPRGQEIVGSTCVALSCTGRQILNAARTACISCPSGQVAKNGNCVCPSTQDLVSGRCLVKCTNGKIRFVNSQCECPYGKRDFTSGTCRASCAPGQERIGGTCRARCTGGKVRSGISCILSTPPIVTSTPPTRSDASSILSPRRRGCMGAALSGRRRDMRFLSKTCEGMGYPGATCYREQSAGSATKEGVCL